MPEPSIGFRPTAAEAQILAQWITDHTQEGGEAPTTSDALRAAIDALKLIERRKAQQREHSRLHSRPRVLRTITASLPRGEPETIRVMTRLDPEGTSIIEDSKEPKA